MRSDNPECDWVEDFAHENGNYQNKCVSCYKLFFGHKRRVVCKCCDSPIIAPSIEQAAEPFAVANQFKQHQDIDIKYLRKVIDEKCNKWKEFKNYHEDDKEIMMSLMIQGANHLKQQGWKSKEEVEGIVKEVLKRVQAKGQPAQEIKGSSKIKILTFRPDWILTTEYKDLLG